MSKSRDYLSWALAGLALGFTGLYGLEAHSDTELSEAEARAKITIPHCVAHAAGKRGETLLLTCEEATDISGIPQSFEWVVIRTESTQQRCRVVASKPAECVAQSAPTKR